MAKCNQFTSLLFKGLSKHKKFQSNRGRRPERKERREGTGEKGTRKRNGGEGEWGLPSHYFWLKSCTDFPPGPRIPSQPESITAPWQWRPQCHLIMTKLYCLVTQAHRC